MCSSRDSLKHFCCKFFGISLHTGKIGKSLLILFGSWALSDRNKKNNIKEKNIFLDTICKIINLINDIQEFTGSNKKYLYLINTH